ncbi:hypothetical protein ACJX0J_036689, partial [Zea mays]
TKRLVKKIKSKTASVAAMWSEDRSSAIASNYILGSMQCAVDEQSTNNCFLISGHMFTSVIVFGA